MSGWEFDTYKVLPSGEKPMPLGWVMSVITGTSLLSWQRHTALNLSSFLGSASILGRPKDGSVNHSAPSLAKTRSLGLFSRLPWYLDRTGFRLPRSSMRSMVPIAMRVRRMEPSLFVTMALEPKLAVGGASLTPP